MIEVGRVCIKTMGREAGRKCVVIDIIDENFALITGPRSINGVKRRRVNIKHIEPTPYKLEIPRGATDDEVVKAIEKAGLRESFETALKPERRVVV
jgi:large subunit ribosomal protein L14e